MKRLAIAMLFVGLFSACHHWVGRPVRELERKMGRPISIRPQGPDRIYVYRDTLAGYGEMTFTVDSNGIIRAWDATSNVPGVFGGDVFGTNDAGGVLLPPNP
jgi:hypothetical protein